MTTRHSRRGKSSSVLTPRNSFGESLKIYPRDVNPLCLLVTTKYERTRFPFRYTVSVEPTEVSNERVKVRFTKNTWTKPDADPLPDGSSVRLLDGLTLPSTHE